MSSKKCGDLLGYLTAVKSLALRFCDAFERRSHIRRAEAFTGIRRPVLRRKVRKPWLKLRIAAHSRVEFDGTPPKIGYRRRNGEPVFCIFNGRSEHISKLQLTETFMHSSPSTNGSRDI